MQDDICAPGRAGSEPQSLAMPQKRNTLRNYILGTSPTPGSPVVSSAFQCRGRGFDPGQGSKVPHATGCGQKKFFFFKERTSWEPLMHRTPSGHNEGNRQQRSVTTLSWRSSLHYALERNHREFKSLQESASANVQHLC